MSPFKNRARPIFVRCSVSRTAFSRKAPACQTEVLADGKQWSKLYYCSSQHRVERVYVFLYIRLLYLYTKFRVRSFILCQHKRITGNFAVTLLFILNIRERITYFKLHKIFVKSVIKSAARDGHGVRETKVKSKAVPLHAMEAHGGRGGIAPTHS
jgi:hypothetical protein